MSQRVAAAAALVLAIGTAPAMPAHATPGESAIGAQASVVVRGEGATRFLVRFTVLRRVPGASIGRGAALLGQVFRCSLGAPSCPQSPVSEEVSPLPDTALILGGKQGAAALRAVWAGRPLAIVWKPTGAAGPRPTRGDTLVSDDGNSKVVYENFRLANTSASVALLGGHGCKAAQPYVVSADAAAATWQAATAWTQRTSPDHVPGLVATQGRCG